MIQIYGPENKNFEKNGDMALFPTSCPLTCEINGAWELTMSHPLDMEERWRYIEEGAVIGCPTFQGDNQLFRIEKVVMTDATVEATAYPIFFDSADDCFLMDTRPTNMNGQQALNAMTAGSAYTGQSDITTTSTAYFVRRNLMDAINGEDEPTFVQVWGGEILYDNFKVIINEKIGGDYGYEVRYGKNQESISHTVDMTDVVTRIVPVAYNGRMMSGDTQWVDSENINKYPKKYIREVVFEDVKLAEDVDSEQDGDIICQTQQELDAALEAKCEAMYAAGADLPAVSIEVSLVDLEHTEQYKDVKSLVKVALGDTVHCINTNLNITTDARVIRMTWDCIQNQVTDVALGDYEYNYFNDVTSALQAVDKVIGPGDTVIAERVSGVLNAINTQLRYQKNVAQRQDVRAILFEDTDPKSSTFGAMCLGTQGFQIADTRTADGRDWDWTTAFTAKGGYANVLIAGLLSDKTGKSYWNLDTGELQLSGDFIQRATNGTLAVTIKENMVSVYDWEGNGDLCGYFGTAQAQGASTFGVALSGAPGKIITIGTRQGSSITPVIQYDPNGSDETPFIMNTANGKIFGQNSRGITVENGLITDWGLNTANANVKAIVGLSWANGGITKINYAEMKFQSGILTGVTLSSESF